MAARRVVVHGRVQGVFFRSEAQQLAERHGVAGWVRNRPDGAVEAHLEGPDEAVAAVEAWMSTEGPSGARISDAEGTDVDDEGLDRFEVRG